MQSKKPSITNRISTILRAAILVVMVVAFGSTPASTSAAVELPKSSERGQLAAPTATAFSNLSWCFLKDYATIGAIGENDTFRVQGTLTNGTGIPNSFRIGVRLRTSDVTLGLRDHTFGGPTHLFGHSTATEEGGGGGPIVDLNLLGDPSPAGSNVEKESFGEVQNILPLADGASGNFVVQLNPGSTPVGTAMRVELYAYDFEFNTLQTSIVGGSIVYSDAPSGCLAEADNLIDVGTGFTITGVASGQGSADIKKLHEGWINVSKPNYNNADTEVILEFTVLKTETPQYEHDWDGGAFTIKIFDQTNLATPVTTINGNGVDKVGCDTTFTITVGAVSKMCRLQTYYTNVSSVVGRTQATGGYRYQHGAFGAEGSSITYVLTLVIADNTAWLVSGTNYTVEMSAGSGTGSHKTDVPVTDQFSYNVPTAEMLASFSASLVDNGIRLRWETANEYSLNGFNVWRKRGKGEWKVLNSEPIEAKRQGTGRGAVYRYLDLQVKPGKVHKYRIEFLPGTERSQKVKVKVPAQ